MIEFPLDTLRAVAKAATREMDYWRELFDPDSGYFTVRLGVVAVVINAAIEVGVVTLTADAPSGLPLDDYTDADRKAMQADLDRPYLDDKEKAN